MDNDTNKQIPEELLYSVGKELPHTTIHSAWKVAEKIRKAVSERFADGLGVTISIGAACWRNGMRGPEDLVEAADSALYAAKRSGKNSVFSHKP